jgi:hypothetical protein
VELFHVHCSPKEPSINTLLIFGLPIALALLLVPARQVQQAQV